MDPPSGEQLEAPRGTPSSSIDPADAPAPPSDPAPTAAAADDDDGRSEAAPSTSLLSLPPALLAAHLWPLLSPWTRMQLRTTCRELRAWADGLLDEAPRLVVDADGLAYWASSAAAADDSGSAGSATAPPVAVAPDRDTDTAAGSADGTSPSGAEPSVPRPEAAAHNQLDLMCGMLRRCPRMTDVCLFLNAQQQLSLAAAHHLGSASGGHLARLCLTDLQGLHPSLLLAAAAACPALQQLHLQIVGAPNDAAAAAEDMAAAARTLPSSLHTLAIQVEVKAAALTPCLQQLATAMSAATQLTNLRSLNIHADALGLATQLDVSIFAPFSKQLTKLVVSVASRHRSSSYAPGVYHVLDMDTLLDACGHSLEFLSLPLSSAVSAMPFPQLLRRTPQLRSLQLDADTSSYTVIGHLADHLPAMAVLTSLTSLSVPCQYAGDLCRIRAAAAGSLGHLQQLHVRGSFSARVMTKLLGSQLLDPECLILLDEPADTAMRLTNSWGWDTLNTAALAAKTSSGAARLCAQLSDGTLVPRACSLEVRYMMPKDGPAAVKLLKELEGLILTGQATRIMHEACAAVVASSGSPHDQQAGTSLDAAGIGPTSTSSTAAGADAAGVQPSSAWMLPAMSHMTVLVLLVDESTTMQAAELLQLLPAVLSAGHLPHLTSLVLDHKGGAHRGTGSCHAQLLAPIARLLAAHPGITVRLVPAPSAWALEQLRLQAQGLKDGMQPNELDALMAWLLG